MAARLFKPTGDGSGPLTMSEGYTTFHFSIQPGSGNVQIFIDGMTPACFVHSEKDIENQEAIR
jgi:hypothetical protein